MKESPGRLFLVATPIGNLKDITFRAVEVLKNVDLVACEDTRHSRHLLDAYDIRKPVVSLFQAKENPRTRAVLQRLSRGENVAFITDAGTPNISDPGFRLVSECARQGIEVISVPGPCALISALSVSGLPTDAFRFEGFLPPKRGARVRKMKSWQHEKGTIVYYESPHRIAASLRDLREVYGNVRVVLARELTKKFEEMVRAPLEDILERFETKNPVGEYVVLLNLRIQNPGQK